MRVLFIGGTGNISSAVSRLAIANGVELYHLNRGQRKVEIAGVKSIRADIHDPAAAAKALGEQRWDCVVNWIAFHPRDVEVDLELFRGRTQQYIFISSASVYQKPPTHPIITESTPLCNPYWEYSRNKIACEERLNRAYREEAFPITIVRPSLTYDTVIPLAIGGWGDYTIVDRMKRGLPVVVHGDGASLWTTTHSEDFAKGFVGLLGNQQAIGHAFHITSDEVLTWNQHYEAVAAAIGVKPNLVHIPSDALSDICDKLGQPWMRGSLLGDKTWSCIFDNTKIKRFVPGFQATITFAEGMRKTIAWYHADPARCKVTPEKDDIVAKILKAWQER